MANDIGLKVKDKISTKQLRAITKKAYSRYK